MHQCGNIVKAAICTAGAALPSQLVVDHALASIMFAALIGDAKNYHYSSCVSVCEAIRGVRDGNYSWAVVKLYYSVFYSIRSLLATNGVSIFYNGTKPWSIDAVAGSQPQKRSGTTHEVVYRVFSEKFPSNPLIGEIEGVNCFNWLKKLREDANYKLGKFVEPSIPSHFQNALSVGLRRSLHAYQNDAALSYAFDKDHAAIAYPIACLKRSYGSITKIGTALPSEDVEYIASLADAIAETCGLAGCYC